MDTTNVTKDILQFTGDKVSEISSKLMGFISEKIGTEPSLFSYKLLSILFLLVVLFFSFKIGHKLTKFAMMIVSAILIISLVYTFFN